MNNLIEKLYEKRNLNDNEFFEILKSTTYDNNLRLLANKKRLEIYDNFVYIRGLIEISNYCKNNCFYCGIRSSNKNVDRYHLNKTDILKCCHEGYKLGFRTFVLQGGEDVFYTDEILIDIISEIRNNFMDCAITLSLGERTYESYKKLYQAGANRYLLRHETANSLHYNQLHPKNMKLSNRQEALFNLKKIGFQVGSGMMVGSPYQRLEYIVEDLRFLQKLQPDMIGIGPYLTHKDTPFKNFENGDMNLTLKLISILRLMFPYSLIPSTTALGTIHPKGRELGLQAGGNVVMPNLSPSNVRSKYELYNNKVYSGSEAAESIAKLKKVVHDAGYEIIVARGDVKKSR
ncbi:[FeFe] hydrogenase H-cluster radical SAM maturase HydE [Miniphocaeibacter massiliensis]|uniref:[FeFe] hydrogenase H-cluster radical SAM maturase HydE n=1 Tax=Miniphocaeibacter massiliensis TaxID=2041841 RepID=UPI000C1B989B|nr:[FeFe] hydrogenase H-cluster radical SAM maturase HydE [Miniphocaeibacter massiliensis]